MSDDLRSPHLRLPEMDTVADGMEPAGRCEDCGHFAMRHSRLECLFHKLEPKRYKPCKCEGMLWEGKRYVMDPSYGPLEEAPMRL